MRSLTLVQALSSAVLHQEAADLYPRQGRTMEWDTAAGQAVAEAAGGVVLKLEDRSPLMYGKEGLDNPHFLVGLPSVVSS